MHKSQRLLQPSAILCKTRSKISRRRLLYFEFRLFFKKYAMVLGKQEKTKFVFLIIMLYYPFRKSDVSGNTACLQQIAFNEFRLMQTLYLFSVFARIKILCY